MDPVITRILALVDNCELNEKQILQKLEITSSSTISDWRSEKSKTPSVNNVIKFADFFGVSTDYLLTGKINYDSITDAEMEWLNLYKQLSIGDPLIRAKCIEFVKGYIERDKIQQKKEKENANVDENC